MTKFFLLLAVGIAIGAGSFFAWDRWNTTVVDGTLHLADVALANQAEAFIQPVSQATYNPIRDFTIEEPVIQARAAVVYDVQSGKVLFGKDHQQRFPIASIAKLMTGIVAEKHFDLSETYSVRSEDLNLDGSGADLLRNERLIGTDLMKIMLIPSSNDAASVFASAARERELDFIELMNDEAKASGLADTYFSDATGLDDVTTYSTAFDVAKLTGSVPRDSAIWEMLRIPETVVLSADGKHSHHLVSTNKLLGVIPGIVGGKTGNTTGALGTMTLLVDVGNERDMIAVVVLGSYDRSGEIKTLVDWALAAHRWEQ